MSELSIFELFLSAGNLNPVTRVVFQAKTQAKIVSIESRPRDGYMTIGCGNDAQFSDLCALIGLPELGGHSIETFLV